jgi:hypothetical protein
MKTSILNFTIAAIAVLFAQTSNAAMVKVTGDLAPYSVEMVEKLGHCAGKGDLRNEIMRPKEIYVESSDSFSPALRFVSNSFTVIEGNAYRSAKRVYDIYANADGSIQKIEVSYLVERPVNKGTFKKPVIAYEYQNTATPEGYVCVPN